MNVELINPASVLRLLVQGDPAEPRPGPRQSFGWVRRLSARLAEEIRYQRALLELLRLDGRDLEDLDLAPADFPALARRHAKGLPPLSRARR